MEITHFQEAFYCSYYRTIANGNSYSRCVCPSVCLTVRLYVRRWYWVNKHTFTNCH